MRDFFHGWRRKFGVLTLAMACVHLAGWIDSFTPKLVTIGKQTLTVEKPMYGGSQAFELIEQPDGTVTLGEEFRSGGVPWWVPTISLTLLSACLLLSKPSVAKPPESTNQSDERKVPHA